MHLLPTGDRTHRRGGIYVAVLGAAVLTITLGLSALMASRLTEQRSAVVSATGHAALLAESAVELALDRLTADSNWRQTYTHNVWTTPQSLDLGTVSFKLVDVVDGNLANNPTQGLRLYGKGEVAGAVRIVGVDLESVTVANNLLTNADLETGTTSGWYRYTGTATLAVDTTNPHDGDYSLHISNRLVDWAGPVQIITGKIINNQPYAMRAWVRMKDTTEKVVFYMRVNGSLSGDNWFSAESIPVQTGWTQVTATITPSWQGTQNYAYWSIGTKNSTQEFWVDDAVLYRQSQPTHQALRIVAGSWRRDVNN